MFPAPTAVCWVFSLPCLGRPTPGPSLQTDFRRSARRGDSLLRAPAYSCSGVSPLLAGGSPGREGRTKPAPTNLSGRGGSTQGNSSRLGHPSEWLKNSFSHSSPLKGRVLKHRFLYRTHVMLDNKHDAGSPGASGFTTGGSGHRRLLFG